MKGKGTAKILILSILLAMVWVRPAHCLPEVAEVVSGTAQIQQVNPTTLSITASENSIINYKSFSINDNESVVVSLPSSQSQILNRVVGTEASNLFGSLSCNGIFLLVNPAGIRVGPSGNIQAASLILSTRNIADNDFLSGNYVFKKLNKDDLDRLLLNEGTVRVSDNGFAAFIAGAVENKGYIAAKLGTIALAAGNAVKIDLSPDGMISVAILEPVAKTVLDYDGKPVSDQIKNTGTLDAQGGMVLIKAQSINKIFASAINLEGVVKGTKVIEKDGQIQIEADGNVTINADMQATRIEVAGKNVTVGEQANMLAEESIDINANDVIAVEGVIRAPRVNLNSLGGIDSSRAAIIQAQNLYLSTNRFGTYTTPVYLDSPNLYLTRLRGDFDIREATGIGTTVLIRGPPEDGFGSILYNKDANLYLETTDGNIYGARGITIFASNLSFYARQIDFSGNITALNKVELISLDKTTLGSGAYISAPAGYILLKSINGDTILEADTVVDVSANAIGGIGGRVEVLGKNVSLIGAQINATGEAGGGTVLIGGDYQGKGTVPNVQTTYIGRDTYIYADAACLGNGGTVIVWSDEDTRYYGHIGANGGPQGGNAGFVQISGANYYEFNGYVDAQAANGARGTFIMEPYGTGGYAASIATDLLDYKPGEIATITGSGWQAGETVSLTLHPNQDNLQDITIVAKADAKGNFSDSSYTLQDYDRGVVFALTATGQVSGATARASFTDATITSTATGGTWATGTTWVGGVAPAVGDTVIIATTGANSVTIGATLTQTAAGSVTINSGATLIATTTGTTVTFGALTIASTGTFTTSRVLTVLGATNISGTINLQTTARADVFTGDVTLNSGAVWNETIANTPTFSGNFTNNATTFTASTGLYTFSGAAKAISGSTTTSIPSITFSGTYTNTGTLTSATAFTVTGAFTNNGTITATTLLTVTGVTLTNNGTITATTALSGTGGVTQGTTGILNIGGTSGITTLTATAVGNIVKYTGVAQTCKVTTYDNLTLSGSGTKTFATTPTVNAILSMEGAATVSAAPTYGAAATLQYNTATARTAGVEWITPFAATGGVIIGNTGLITLNAAKVFNTSVPLTINSGAALSTSGSNYAVTFGGNFINNGGTFTAGSSAITITGTATTQSIAGFTTTGLVSMTKTGGTATFTGNVNGAGLTINGTGGTLNLGVSLTHTFTGTWTRTNGTLDGGSSILNFSLAGTVFSGTGATFTANAGTVNYSNAAAQTFPALTYNNLTLSGGGVKTVATTPTVNGILSMEGTATLTVTTGVVTYGAAATLQYKGSSLQTTNAEFPATFDGSGGVIINNASGVNLGGSKAITYGLTLTSGAFGVGTNTLTLNGAVSATSGSLTSAATGTVIYGSGSAQTIVAGTYGNLTSSGAGARTLASSGTIGVAGTFTPGTNSYTITGSTIDFTSAGSQNIPAFNYNNLSNSGNGARVLASSGTVGIAGTFTPGAGAYTLTGSTVNYYGSSQAIAAMTYNNLTINQSSGDATLNNNATVNGILTLTAGNLAVTDPYILDMGASATTVGATDVTGIVRRTSFVAGTVYTFGNQYNTVVFENIGTLPTEMSAKITIGAAPAWKTDAVQRYIEMIQSGASGSYATLNTHYLDSELNGNTKDKLVLWTYITAYGMAFESGRSNYSKTQDWVGVSGVDVSQIASSFGQISATLGDSHITSATWNGSVSTNWVDVNNWTPNGVPSDLADIVIPDAATTPHDPTLVLGQDLTISRMTINSGGILNTTNSSSITVSGASGAWSNNGGTFNPGTSTVIFTNAAATISGVTNFYNVTINPGAGLTMGSSTMMRIAGTMTNNGTWAAAGLGNQEVEYNGGSQTVLNPNGVTPGYCCLFLSGSGTKTMPGTALNIIEDFSISGTASAIAGAAINTGLNFTVGSGASFTAGAYTHTIGGDFSNSGTFTATGSTITLNGTIAQAIGGTIATAFNNLNISNTSAAVSANTNFSAGGTLTVDSGAVLNPAAAVVISGAGTLTGNGTVNVTRTAATADFSSQYTISNKTLTNLTVDYVGSAAQTGSALIYGGLMINNTNGVTLAGAVTANGALTINSGASLATGNFQVTFGGNFVNNGGTFTAGSSPIVIANIMPTQSIAGFTTTGTVSMTKTDGIATFTGNVNGGALTFNGSGGTLDLGVGLTHTFSGAWTRTAGAVLGDSSKLNIGGTTTNTAGTFTAGTSTVNYYAAGAQTIANVTYNNLTLSGSGIKTTTGATVNGILSMEGAATVSAAPTYGAAATLQYNTATGRTVGAEWITPFLATGGVIIGSTGTITLNAAKVFNASVPLTINSGATLATGNFQVTFGGNFVNNGGTFTAGSSAIVIANTMTTQSIAGFTTTGLVSMTKTGGTATFTGNVNGAGLTINGTGGTLNLGVGLTHTFTGTWTRTNGTLNGGSSILNFSLAGTVFSGTGGTFTAGTGTVNYNNAAAQTFPALTYNNLTLSGGGVKTVATTPTITGILSMEGTATVVVTTGVVTYGANATLQYNTATARTASSEEWITPFAATGGVIIANTGTITLDTTKVLNANIPLTINNGSTLNIATFNLTVGGNLGGAGTLTQGTGSLTVSGDLIDSVRLTFAPMGATSVGTITLAGNWLSTGTLTASYAGVILTGTGKQITGPSSGIIFLTLTVNGTYTNNNTSGGITVVNVLNGSGTLTQGTNAVLNIEGTVGLTTLNTTANTPNTVNYVGANGSTQTVRGQTYYNLTISGGGIKTLGGAVAINGALNVEEGIFDPASYTVTGNGGTNALVVGEYGTLNVNTLNFSGNYTGFVLTLGDEATVNYSGAGSQNIDNTIGYHNLTISGSGTKTLLGTTTAHDDITINSGSTLATNNYGVTLGGNWVNNGTFTQGVATVTFNGSEESYISGTNTFSTLEINKTNNEVMTLNNIATTNLTITSGTLRLGGITLTMSGTFTNYGTLKLIGTETLTGFTNDTAHLGTVDYYGNDDYTTTPGRLVAGNSYYNLTFSGKGLYALNASLVVAGNLTLGNFYTAYKIITIDYNQVGGTTLTDFPMLFSVTDSDLKTVANGGKVTNANGYDIIFTTPAGANLDYEIEKYDPTTGQLIAWIKVPSVSSTQNTLLYIYYGNSTVTTSQQNPSGVWTNAYAGVWHMKETSGPVDDSTVNANNGTPTNVTEGIAAQIDGGDSFNGTSSLINCGNDASLNITGAVTESAWIYFTAGAIDQKVSSNQSGQSGGYKLTLYTDNRIEFEVRDANNAPYADRGSGSPLALLPNTWYYVVGVYSQSGGYIQTYVNGTLYRNYATTGVLGPTPVSFYIGREPYDVILYWHGSMDEVRVANVSRPAGWIAAEYNNQKTSSTFYSVGAQNLISPTLNAGSNNMTVSGNWINNGTFNPGTATVTFDGGNATIYTGGAGAGKAFNNVIINTTGTKTLGGDMLINKDLQVNAGTFAGTYNTTVKGGNVTGSGIINMTDGLFNVQGTGSFGGSTNDWTFYDLSFGDGTSSTTTTKSGSNNITVTDNLAVNTNHTLLAGTSNWNLVWASYLKNISQISSGYDDTIALTTDGYVFSWGLNVYGQLGNNSQINSLMPVQVLSGAQGGGTYLHNISVVSAGGWHNLVVAQDGSVYSWGYNLNGQLGNNSITDSWIPVQVLSGAQSGGTYLHNISTVSGGGSSSAAVASDGSVFTWGFNGFGELGNNSTADSPIPVQVLAGAQSGGTNLHNITQVAVGGAHMAALGPGGTVFTWGYNAFGQLGNNSTSDSWVPVQVVGVDGTGTLANISQVSAGDAHVAALGSDGSVYAWGFNAYGELGNNSTTDSWIPVQVFSGIQGGGTYLHNITQISAGAAHNLAIGPNGYVFSWGDNRFGQLGNGTTVNGLIPVEILSGEQGGQTYLHDITQLAAGGAQTVALSLSRPLFDCGNNDAGQLGNGTTVGAVAQIRVFAGSQAGPNISHTPLTLNGTLTPQNSNIIYGQDLYHLSIYITPATYYNLTLSNQTNNILSGSVIVQNNLAINSATLSAGSYGMTVSGNWTNTGGTFSAGTGTVTFNSTTQGQTVATGGSAFNILTITNNTAAGVTFADRLVTATLNASSGVQKISFALASAIAPNTITTTFNVNGSAGHLIELAPAIAYTTWYIDAPTSSHTYLKVGYSYEAAGKTLTATSSTNLGGNTNWNITP